MFIKRWRRHLRDSFVSIGRNGWMSFASIAAVTVTLLLVGVFLSILLNLNKVVSDFENDVEIKVLVKPSVLESKAIEMQQAIAKMDGVADVRYSTKQDELNQLIEEFGDDLSLFDQDNPLHNVIYIKATSPEQTAVVAKQVATMNEAEKVLYGKDKIDKVFHVVNVARTVGVIFIVALILIAAFLIANTIKLTISARRNEIEIMKLVGATNQYVRGPFLLEGIWLGIIGTIVPIIIVSWGYVATYEQLARVVESQNIAFLQPKPFLWKLNSALFAMGIVIGAFGSVLSMRKYLRVK